LDPLEFEGTAGVDYPFGNLHTTCVNYATKEVILFGGKSNRYSNTTFVFSSDTLKWKKIETKGSTPSPRYGHSAVIYNNKMYVFGGYDNEGGKCNDLYVLSLDTKEWAMVKMSGAPNWPEAKYNHQATVMAVNDKDYMVVFGGSNGTCALSDVNAFDLHAQTWYKDIKTAYT